MREPSSVALFLKEDYMQPLGCNAKVLSAELGITEERLLNILEHEESIDTKLAYKLAKRFNTDEDFWIKVQARYLGWKEDGHE